MYPALTPVHRAGPGRLCSRRAAWAKSSILLDSESSISSSAMLDGSRLANRYPCCMRSMREIRRANLRILVDDAGSQVELAARVGKDKNQIHQWLLDPSQPAARGMRDQTARAIEKKCNRPEGWMDHEHDAASGVAEEAAVYQVDRDAALLRSAILITERAFAAKRVSVTPEARAEITLAAYDMLREGQNVQSAQRVVARLLQAFGGGTTVTS